VSSASSPERASPKSRSIARPSGVSAMFDGLTSRCTKSRPCACASAVAIWRAMPRQASTQVPSKTEPSGSAAVLPPAAETTRWRSRPVRLSGARSRRVFSASASVQPRIALHREEGDALVLADGEDRHDPRVLQAGDGLGFAAEALAAAGEEELLGPDELQSDRRASGRSAARGRRRPSPRRPGARSAGSPRGSRGTPWKRREGSVSPSSRSSFASSSSSAPSPREAWSSMQVRGGHSATPAPERARSG
jgi:hypothetical protein